MINEIINISARIENYIESIRISSDLPSAKEINKKLLDECVREIESENASYILKELAKKESFTREDLAAYTRIAVASYLATYSESLDQHLKVDSIFPPPLEKIVINKPTG